MTEDDKLKIRLGMLLTYLGAYESKTYRMYAALYKSLFISSPSSAEVDEYMARIRAEVKAEADQILKAGSAHPLTYPDPQ